MMFDYTKACKKFVTDALLIGAVVVSVAATAVFFLLGEPL